MTTTPRKTAPAKRSIIVQVEHVNRLLKTELPQSFKSTLCTLLEKLLMEANMYAGFNSNYWLETGYKDWMTSGQPEGKEKATFIVGPKGCKDTSFDSSFTHTIQGFYSRTYFVKNRG